MMGSYRAGPGRAGRAGPGRVGLWSKGIRVSTSLDSSLVQVNALKCYKFSHLVSD